MKSYILLLLAIGAFAISAAADVPPNRPQKNPTNEMTGRLYVDLRSDVKVPTLKIRREVLKQLRASIDEADDAQNELASADNDLGLSRTPTVVGGTLFSLAFIFGGVWLFRKPAGAAGRVVPVILLAVFAAGAIVILANSPPPSVTGLTTRIFDKKTRTYGYAAGNIKIQILDRQPGVFKGSDRDAVILEIPSDGEDKDPE